MPDFKQGKIYKIVDITSDKTYVGSTCQTLENRLSGHKYVTYSKVLKKK